MKRIRPPAGVLFFCGWAGCRSLPFCGSLPSEKIVRIPPSDASCPIAAGRVAPSPQVFISFYHRIRDPVVSPVVFRRGLAEQPAPLRVSDALRLRFLPMAGPTFRRRNPCPQTLVTAAVWNNSTTSGEQFHTLRVAAGHPFGLHFVVNKCFNGKPKSWRKVWNRLFYPHLLIARYEIG